ncbi:HAD hydrolase-like protein [Halorubrum sp. JWXQ-INN 858]|uniref:HAD family hydrolase n=1 Tax=Halorubrum sp. JWXQ-INN 858 TaxID=2690782 RepID=UPI00135B7CC8|nr:HAD hydrolase-like protein [Halorubrum sp. JWXQ-INN 858]MWV63922.1 HAD hydrolase-like protein [Halorubrum sp. JWXQ-INN 858]
MTFDPTDYDAVVYDLDGTVVDLAVDWGAVADDVLAVYAGEAIKPPGDDLWDLLGAAEEYGIGDAVEAAIAEHERDGARRSTRLPLGDRLAGEGEREGRNGGNGDERGPIAVCSLNCEAACRIALGTHGIDGEVDAVVGRDTVATYKPDPEPLLAALDALGADPGRAVFVGDSDRDAVTAERAGVPFVWVADAVDA